MDKDFEYEQFQAFMRHLSGIGEAIGLEQRARTFSQLESLDELENKVSTRPMYNSAEELINSVKDMK